MQESDYPSLEYDHGDHEFDSEVVLFLLLSYHAPSCIRIVQDSDRSFVNKNINSGCKRSFIQIIY